MYWSLPAYTANHLLLATLWTVFIVIGTLVFEEGGLKGDDEFGVKYHAYSQDVGMHALRTHLLLLNSLCS